MRDMIKQAVVLVGGLGTRLGALTQDTPKPLLDVGGRPFLSCLVGELQRQGVTDVLLLAGFKAERLEALVREMEGIRVVVEPEPLGTGGALRFARELLEDRFFFLNGDSIFDVNLWDLARGCEGSEAHLALRPVPDVSRYGPATLTGDRITHFAERPEAAGPGLINGGVAVLSRAILDRLAPEGPVSIEREVYPRLAAEGLLSGKAYDRPFIDIGVPEDLAIAQTFVPAMLTRGAIIFDRDGVLNVDINYAHKPNQITWIDGAINAVKAANDAGLLALVATNQAGVAHGYYEERHVLELHTWMNQVLRKHGAQIDAFAYSPYHPEAVIEAYRRVSDCRKPGPGMLRSLLGQYGVDPARAVMIGDRLTDLEAAQAAGVRGLLFEGGNLHDTLAGEIERLAAACAP